MSAAIFAPGFFSSGEVHVAVTVGALTAIVAGAVGVFTVIRGQSFAGEALSHIGTAGESGAYLAGAGALWGLVAAALVAAGLMEAAGVQRSRGRDLATGIVLSGAMGVAALFIYLQTVQQSTSGAAFTILFGSIFTISSSTVPLVAACSAASLALVALLFRPLLLSSLSAEIAQARGIPVRLVGLGYLVALALTVALASISVGTILSTALLIGPAAISLRLTRSPLPAMAAAATIGVAATWVGILMSYDSYTWPPFGHGWPASFFIVALLFTAYLAAGVAVPLRRAARAGER